MGRVSPTVLVVEDDDRTRELISTALASANYDVLQARDGIEGLSTMLRFEGEIALAVLEIKLPGMGGLDLANQISVDRPSTEFLYVSNLTRSVAVESIAAGKPEAILKRPFSGRELLSRVRRLLAA
jgi:DNA-binding response OmpR family regulator